MVETLCHRARFVRSRGPNDPRPGLCPQGPVTWLDMRGRAKVQGSHSQPYKVSMTIASPTNAEWSTIEQALQARLGYAATSSREKVQPTWKAVRLGRDEAVPK